MAKNYTSEEYGRNFAFVQLVENLPDGWEERLSEMCIPMAYIIHGKDRYTELEFKKNPELLERGLKVGDEKKPHVHFFAYFNGKRTIGGVLKMFEWLGIGWVELVVSKNAKLGYFLHWTAKDKYQYTFDQLHVLNGLKVNPADLAAYDFGDVMEFIDEHGITSFYELTRATKKANKALFRYITGHYSLVCAYMTDMLIEIQEKGDNEGLQAV